MSLEQNIIEGRAKAFTDSRINFSSGDLFIALVGESHDAARFVPDLIARGLCHAVVTDNTNNRALLKEIDSQKIQYVADTTHYLQELAHNKLENWRAQDKKRKVLALTGSNGKTTTKEMLAWLLGAYPGKVHVTKGNLNNHFGVPYTILEMPLETEILVLEMGTNHPGEIARLCEIAVPDAGLITNIGQSHLEFFHNEDNVMVEKSALYHAIVKRQGTFIVNTNDSRLKVLATKPNAISAGTDKDCAYKFTINEKKITVATKDFSLEVPTNNIPEEHNRFNMAMALSLCASQWSDEKFLKDLMAKAASYKSPRNNRSMLLRNETVTIYLDAYNANPSSMSVSLDGFCKWWVQEQGGDIAQIWFILADMNELGDRAPEYHREIGAKLKQLGAKQVTFIGRYREHYLAGYGAAESFADRFEFLAKHGLGPANWQASIAFIKGSRTLQLEELIDITVFPVL